MYVFRRVSAAVSSPSVGSSPSGTKKPFSKRSEVFRPGESFPEIGSFVSSERPMMSFAMV
jgi:hypothetical protein